MSPTVYFYGLFIYVALMFTSAQDISSTACGEEEFSCLIAPNVTGCVANQYMCNERSSPECIDGYDEDLMICRMTPCPTGTFDCQASRFLMNPTMESFCIPLKWKCDSDKDCDQGEDEDDCGCGKDDFICGDGSTCIPRDYVCDGLHDCPTSDDEHPLCNFTCATGLHMCANGIHCYPPEERCNGVRNCGDWSDEDPDMCMAKKTCEDGSYKCQNGDCISWTFVCNGNDECGDNSDEDLCGIQECSDPLMNNCSQLCLEHSIGYACSCLSGYKLHYDGKQCDDIDECNELPLQCDDLCVNSVGSYSCSCKDGYSLGSDNKTCTQDQYEEPWILYSSYYFVNKSKLDGEENQLLSTNSSRVNVLGIDIAENLVYYGDAMDGFIKRMDISGGSQETLKKDDLKYSLTGLAVDWVTKKLYISNGYGTMIVMQHNGTQLKTFESHSEEPRGIALYPQKGYLYWADPNLFEAFIGRMGMDGTQASRLIRNDLLFPVALTIDIGQGRLYWGDTALDKIIFSDLDGNNQQTLVSDLQYIVGLSFFEKDIYWTDGNTYFIETANRLTGEGRAVVRKASVRPYGIHIWHSSLQPKLFNPCGTNNGGCSHLCLIAFGGEEVTCACPDEFILEPDGKSCKANCILSYQFECGRSDHKCISKQLECDGKHDCLGGEDEHPACANRTCSPGFECDICINYDQVCNGVRDCDNGLDESEDTCSDWPCSALDFQCTSGVCIPGDWECDGEEDCLSGNDEHEGCQAKKCADHQFQCDNGYCISDFWVCDMDNDCGDNSDEPRDYCNDPTKNQCREGWSRCGKNYRCIADYMLCDGTNDCRDTGTDEDREMCGAIFEATCHPYEFECDGGCLPMAWKCDHIENCRDGSDEDPAMCENEGGYRSCFDFEFTCDNKRCIPMAFYCDLDNDCVDNSDENPLVCDYSHVTCASSQFRCDTGHCVPASFQCDSERDCSDASDERDCPTVMPGRYCPKSPLIYECPTHVCITTDWLCDGADDCGDNSDESFSACARVPCDDEDRFKCSNGRCLYQYQVCDKIDDCTDGSDENLDLCAARPCNDYEFRCHNGTCVPGRYVCDTFPDCVDLSDEYGCHRRDEGPGCEENNGGCMQLCSALDDGGHICACQPGFESDPTNKAMCIDKDECSSQESFCPQVCLEKKGGYDCACHEQFKQVNTGIDRCEPLKGDIKGSLLIAVEDVIKIYNFANQTLADAVIAVRKVGNLAVDISKRMVFWTDILDKAIYRAAIPGSSSQLSSPQKVVDTPDLEPTAIAYDWVGRNLYITEMTRGRISVSREDGAYMRTLLEDPLRRPGSIAVNPALGMMYWVDPDQRKIEQAWMDGTNVNVFLTETLGRPSGISIDYWMDNRIYFVDEQTNRIESINSDGTGRITIMPSDSRYLLRNPISIDVLHTNMFWASKDGSVLQMDKFGRGINTTLVARGQQSVPSDLLLIQDLKYDTQMTNPCVRKKCWPLCLLIPRDAVCACPDNSTFINDTHCDTPTTKPKPLPKSCHCENGGNCVHLPAIGDQPAIPVCKCLPGTSGATCEIGKVLPLVAKTTTTTTTSAPPTTEPYPEKKSPSSLNLPMLIILIIFAVIIVVLAIVMCKRGLCGECDEKKFKGSMGSAHYNVEDGVTTGYSNMGYDT